MQSTKGLDSSGLKSAIKKRGLSIAEVARRARLPYNTVARAALGYQCPRLSTRLAIADALNLEPRRIWPGVA